LSTSGTYNFGLTQSNIIIEEAYKRVGILAPYQIADLINTAQRWINFILSSWTNRGLNLWTVTYNIQNLNPNQNTYYLPAGVNDILEAVIRTSTRNLGGTPFSSAGGVAANCFGGAGNCTQNAPNGYISYTWASQYAIQMVGIQSNTTTSYDLVFEYSNDAGVTWVNAGSPAAQTFVVAQNVWFQIAVPVAATSFRVRETGGGTLDIQQLYFNSNTNDTLMTAISRSEYESYSQKNTTSRPSQYYVQRDVNPYVVIYPTPNTQYNAMQYTASTLIQDIGSLSNTAAIPTRFFRALVSELSYELSLSIPNGQLISSPSGPGIQVPPFDLSKTMELKSIATSEFKNATTSDIERDVPLRIYGDYLQGWSQI
jgi:hypothetical protein